MSTPTVYAVGYSFDSWFYGDFMCRMHHFTQSLCHTASVLVLVAIAVERYLVLLHPFKSRQMMTFRKLVVSVICLLHRICSHFPIEDGGAS